MGVNQLHVKYLNIFDIILRVFPWQLLVSLFLSKRKEIRRKINIKE
jgi:hypothetical protein